MSSSDRLLVLLRAGDADPPALARALGLAAADADQRVRRGGWQLLRIAERAAAEQAAARLTEAGLVAMLVPETEVRAAAQPLLALGGEWTGRDLDLRTGEGAVRVGASGLMLVVQGPIARQYQTSQEVKRTRTATLQGGYRFHLHRHGDPRPVEVDPWSFEFTVPARATAVAGASSLLEVTAWVQALAASVTVDDAFRRLPPDLGVAEPAAGGRLSAAAALGVRGGKGEGPLVLDNLRQFRFYSAWRAAIERRR